MKRLLLALVLGLLSTLILFYFLGLLIAEPKEVRSAAKKAPVMDFIRQKSESDLAAKSRIKPPKPERKPPPPEPKLALNTPPQKPRLQAQAINAPKITLSNSYKGDLLTAANVGSGNMEVIPLVRIAPIYPKKALRLRKEGYVTMRFTINPDGTVRNVEVVDAEPKHLFESAALRAIKKWKFKPKLVGGKAVSQEGEQTINFTLAKE